MNYLCLCLSLFGILTLIPGTVARYASAGLQSNLLKNNLSTV